ncbi:MAG: helix-turn-helix transcriptional regulator [Blautia sp.]|nr:helix-turn-helix transcriptional regulator [Blautia sp.]
MTDPYDRVWEAYNRLLIKNMENGIIHNPYNEEIREYSAIERGDIEEWRQVRKENYEDRRGILSEDPVRQEIDIGIVVVTLSRSAAARGGVSPEACYSLSDATIQAMEKSTDVAVIKHLYRTTEMRYCLMVQEVRQHKQEEENASQDKDNLHITHCKNYIFSHLNSRISVRQIAGAIGLEPNYLSSLFHRCENITLKQYILREKITLAKNMLAYSTYTYVEIANYLGFSSQSHLGEQFRRITGMTMRQYRERYGKEDFLHDVVTQEAQ